jgi:hypothetical protein
MVPGPPVRRRSLVVVPVGAVNVITKEALGEALSLGDEVRALTVVHTEAPDARAEKFREAWSAWHPEIPLTVVRSSTRSLTHPVVDYLRKVSAEERHDRLVVLIPEMHLSRPWLRLLQNQRGFILDRAIRRHTDAVICRLRYRVHVPR